MSEKSLEMRHFQILTHREEPRVAPSWAAGVVRNGESEKDSSKRGGWMYDRHWARTAKWKSEVLSASVHYSA